MAESQRTTGFTKKGQTSIRLGSLERIDDWGEVRALLGLDLPLVPIKGRLMTTRHPDPDEWLARQQEALARSASDDATRSYFSRLAARDAQSAKESDPVESDPATTAERHTTIGSFCANLENAQPGIENRIMRFYQRMTSPRIGMTVAPLSFYEREWAQFCTDSRAAR